MQVQDDHLARAETFQDGPLASNTYFRNQPSPSSAYLATSNCTILCLPHKCYWSSPCAKRLFHLTSVFLCFSLSICLPLCLFKESFKDQRWAWEKSVRAEKRDRDAEREKETFRRQHHHQSDDGGVDAETSLSLSLSLHLYLSSPPLHFFLTLTFGL